MLKKKSLFTDLYVLLVLFIQRARFVIFFFNLYILSCIDVFVDGKFLRLTVVSFENTAMSVPWTRFNQSASKRQFDATRNSRDVHTDRSPFPLRSLYSSVDSFTTFRRYRLSSGSARKTRCRIAGEIAGMSIYHALAIRRRGVQWNFPAIKVNGKR